MKQFLKYVMYREVYRAIRQAGTDSDSGSSPSQSRGSRDTGSPESVDELPVDEGPVESERELRAVLQQMDPYDFEHFVGDIWDRMGWRTTVSSASADEGVDVIARKSEPYDQTTLIQAKRYGPDTTVGSPAIQQYASLDQQIDGADEVVVVTTNEYTSQARDLAERLNVKLINGIDLARIVADVEAADLVDEYLDFVHTVDSEDSSEPNGGHATTGTQTPLDTGPDTAGGTTTTEHLPSSGADPQTETGGNGDSTTDSPGVPTTLSKVAIGLGIPGWVAVFFSVNTLSTSVWGVSLFLVWFGLPLALFLDARYVRQYGNWPRYWWFYGLVSFVPFLGVVPASVYLWHRRSVDIGTAGSTSPDTAATSQPPVESVSGDDQSAVSSVSGDDDPAVKTASAGEGIPAESSPTDGPADDSDQESRARSRPRADSDSVSTQAGAQPESTPNSEDATGTEPAPERAPTETTIKYGGEQVTVLTVESTDGNYTAAYRDGRFSSDDGSAEAGQIFLFQGGELEFSTQIRRPNACAVATDGTLAVVDWNDWGETLSGTLHVFARSGHRLVNHEFDANIGPVALTSDGEYVATSTFNPDCSTYLFETATGEQVLRHENHHGNVQQLAFDEQDGRRRVRLSDPDADLGASAESAYTIDFGGHVVWKSDALRRQDQLDELLRDSETASPRESLTLLSEAMELTSEPYEEQTVAHQIAETHQELAEATRRARKDDTDAQLEHLEAAANHYRQTLPRYAGKRGLADVIRRQGKVQLSAGDESAARESFREIAALEDKYGGHLLTEADQQRLDRL